MRWMFLLLAALGSAAAAPGGNFGLGFILGAPTGLSAKIQTGPLNSVNLLAGWHTFYRGVSVFYADGDYVWYNPKAIPPVSEGKLILYYGPGANFAAASGGGGFGVRFVAGLEYLFANDPFDVFFELGPVMSLVPQVEPAFTAGLGARYFF